MWMRSPVVIAVLMTCSYAELSFGDVVSDWNHAVLRLVRETRTAPPPATRAFAMMHLAMFDAINGIQQQYEPYAVDFAVTPPPEAASPEAAGATAAYRVLVALFPDKSKHLKATWNRSLGNVRPSPSKDAGIEWGEFCAATILALRMDDGAQDVVDYEPVAECGRWQPTLPSFGSPLFPQWPYVTPFAVENASDFRAPAPPACDSLEYAAALLEVQQLGAIDSELRSDDATEIAFFWEDGPGSVTPPGRWQLIAQDLVERFDVSTLQRARIFALLSMTQADAAIVAWDSKYYYDHWRPVTGIRLADLDGNELTDIDPSWEPLLPTPAFPAYTSGHSTFSGSSAELLELLFDNTDLAITVRTPKPPIWPQQLASAVRSYNSLRGAAEEAGQSRIYGGIHWQYDNVAGLQSGRALAQYVFDIYLQPLGD